MLPVSPRKDPTRNSANGFFQQSCSVEVFFCRSCWTTWRNILEEIWRNHLANVSAYTFGREFQWPFVIDSGWQHLTHLGCPPNISQHWTCLELGWETIKFQGCKKARERWKSSQKNNSSKQFQYSCPKPTWTLTAWFKIVFTIFFLLVCI